MIDWLGDCLCSFKSQLANLGTGSKSLEETKAAIRSFLLSAFSDVSYLRQANRNLAHRLHSHVYTTC